jgi:hypothetical protein
MSLAHLHLVLNHVPTVGAVAVLGLLLLGFVRRNDHLKHVGLEVLFVIAIVTLPVYVSGVAAQREMQARAESSGISEISDDAVGAHHDAALIGFTVMELAAFVGWVAMWQSRRRGPSSPLGPSRHSTGLVAATTILLVVALAVMGRAANLGGEIRHPEIVAADAAAPAGDPNRFMTSKIGEVAVNSRWAWPAAEAVHFLGFSLSIGVLLAVNLRILGAMRQVPFVDVHRLLPWGMLGFGANLITGMFFFVGQPVQYIESPPFYWKIVFLMIAGANFLYLTVFGNPWRPADGGDAREERRPGVPAGQFDASVADKAMAIVSISAWLGVLYAGRMLPFLGIAF